METVDYLKLSEQYASFLVAVGGVSITVLTLVLSLGSDSKTPTKVNSRSYLVAALIVATVTCFIGAHMMAETAAFISNAKEIAERKRDDNTLQPDSPSPPTKEIVSGDRLFLLASTNIFIAIILVLFALMLLPASSRKVHAASLAPISGGVFLVIVVVALYWMILGAKYRMPVPQSEWVISCAAGSGLVWGGLHCFFSRPKYGSLMFRVGDLKDPTNLAVKLRDKSDPRSQYLRGQLSPDTQLQLERYDGSSPPSESLQSALVDGLNLHLKGSSLFDKQRFAQVTLTEKTHRLIEQKPQGAELIRLNRFLLEEAYPREIAKNRKYLRRIRPKKLLLLTFAPSVLSTAVSLVVFATIFKEGDPIRLHKARIQDIWFFSFAITLSYAPLVGIGIKTMCGKQYARLRPKENSRNRTNHST